MLEAQLEAMTQQCAEWRARAQHAEAELGEVRPRRKSELASGSGRALQDASAFGARELPLGEEVEVPVLALRWSGEGREETAGQGHPEASIFGRFEQLFRTSGATAKVAPLDVVRRAAPDGTEGLYVLRNKRLITLLMLQAARPGETIRARCVLRPLDWQGPGVSAEEPPGSARRESKLLPEHLRRELSREALAGVSAEEPCRPPGSARSESALLPERLRRELGREALELSCAGEGGVQGQELGSGL